MNLKHQLPLMSPFATGKWEYEDSRHFYFLGSNDYREMLAQQKHCFVLGHRGTGKTTLLKALDWSERLHDPYLRSALSGGDDPFQDGIVGCYIALKFVALPLFEGWLSGSSASTRHLILGSYLRALWLEEAAAATFEIARRHEGHDLSTEVDALDFAADKFFGWMPPSLAVERFDVSTDPILSLRHVREVGSRLRDDLYGYATLEQLSPEQVIVQLKLNRLQQVTNQLFQSFSRLLTSLQPDRQWTFRICMDEGEYLPERTKLTIRTLVRECESPLFLIVAALSDLGIDTLSDGVSLTNDDRFILDLDKRDVVEFRNLIDGIVQSRLRQSPYPCTRFSIQKLLGDPDLNDLLLSVKTEIPAFKKAQVSWRRRSAEEGSYRNSPRGWSPIREYLEETQSIPVADTAERPLARAADNSGYRKKKLAGYLGLLRTFGVERPVYAGWRIVLHSCDNSVRDLLLFLEEARRVSSADLPPAVEPLSLDAVCRFITTRSLGISVQDRALLGLGQQKLDNFDERVIHFTSYARRLLEFFGRLSHRVDFGEAGANIRTPEQGRFVCRLPVDGIKPQSRVELADAGFSRIEQVFLDVLSECSEEGFLKLISYSPETGEVYFRVHRSLARLHGFSYREPQYSTSLDWTAISSVLTEPEHRNLDRVMDRAIMRTGSRRRAGSSEVSQQLQMPLDLQSPRALGPGGDGAE